MLRCIININHLEHRGNASNALWQRYNRLVPNRMINP